MYILIFKIFFETKEFHKKKILLKFELCIKNKKKNKKLFTLQKKKFYFALKCKVLNFLKKF